MGTIKIDKPVLSNYECKHAVFKEDAKVTVDGKNAVIEGVPALSGATVKACDLRAGAALVIAGLATKGVTKVEDIYHIERGYEDMIGKLRGVGADVAIVEDSEPEGRKKSRASA